MDKKEELYSYEKRKFKKYIGNELYNTLKSYNCIVAGGSILSIFNNSEINDIDVYFRNKEDLSDFLHNEMNQQWILAYTDKAFLFVRNGVKVQAIYFQYFDNATDLFKTFDFTVCMGAFDFKNEQFIFHEDFFRHNVSKILKFNSDTAYPIVSALRVQKYKNKGFAISKPEFLKIMLTILNLKIDNYKDLKEQMGGMYGENYDSLLETEEDEEFNLLKVIDNIGKIGETDFDYVLDRCKNHIEDMEDFIIEVTGVKIKYFKYNGSLYRVKDGLVIKLDEDDISDKKFEKVEIDEVIRFPLIKYKLVELNSDGKFISFFDNDYEWVIGENYPENKEYGLFASSGKELSNSPYINRMNKVCLEVVVNSIEDVKTDMHYWSSRNSYNKLTATRMVPRDEVERMIGKSFEDVKCDNFPF